MAEFDPRAIFDALDRHGVRYVLIGGMAAILHGASHVTTDVDVVPQERERTSSVCRTVLKELHARIRVAGEPDGVPFDLRASRWPASAPGTFKPISATSTSRSSRRGPTGSRIFGATRW